jgi:hypothetical protein
MTDKNTANDPTAEKDPDTWVTGGEPATGPQKSYLETLASESDREVPEDLTKADASKMIEELQEQSPRVGGDGS